MYERSLNQILHVLRRIRCLTYGMFLITCATLILYLLHDVVNINRQTVLAISHRDVQRGSAGGFGATVRVKYSPATQCTPTKNIIFTKTHKTGSSTISNILLRYSELYNLTQLLYSFPSSTEYHQLKDFKLLQNRRKANIFAQHAYYDMGFLKEHIYENPLTFTIVRNPISQFISAYSFFEKQKSYSADTFEGSIRRFLASHSKYLSDNWFCKNCQMLVNANSVDMGFSVEDYMGSVNSEEFLDAFLEETSNTYNLVLITEYFDLSLVLLKRRLCLRFEDILYLRSLERIKKENVEDPRTIAGIRSIQRIDVALYNKFNDTFWREVAKEDGIFEELELFQQLNKQVQKFCISGPKVGYKGTLENVMSEQGRDNFYCLGMNTRCWPFSLLLEARDDPRITQEQLHDISNEDTKDSLSYNQLVHLDRKTNILELSRRTRGFNL